ncbi:MAG: hypothetical protein V1799_12595 [bacterium]
MDEEQVLAALAKIEQRVTRIEEHLDLHSEQEEEKVQAAVPTSASDPESDEDELEYELGQSWFAKAGIVALALGVIFILTFPFADIPSIAFALLGYGLAGGMFALAHLWRQSLLLISNYLRGAALALLYFATLRLYFFGETPALTTGTLPEILPLVAAASFVFLLAIRRQSVYLTALAFITGFVTLIVIDQLFFTFLGIALLAVIATLLYLRFTWTWIVVLSMVCGYLTHLLWALNNPVLGHSIQFLTSPQFNIFLLLVYVSIFASAPLLRPDRSREQYSVVFINALNGALGYGTLLIFTLVAYHDIRMIVQIASSCLLLCIAILFWVREQSRYSTFIYAMLGYQALSIALLFSFGVPEVFVLLSLQSLLVVATAILFRSRFIIVANFIIYLFIVTGYLVVAEQETGISIGFGIVALLSARILNWKKERLELQTEMMRNAYLVSAFLVFPYSLYHLVPQGYVALAWVAVALFYYFMNTIIKNQKYRWMGHLTLILTALYVLVIGIIQLELIFRVISFLVLGIVLLSVSIFFTRLRLKKRKQ